MPLAQRGPYIPQDPDIGHRLDMRPYHEPMDQDKHVLRSVKVEAPNFDGSLTFVFSAWSERWNQERWDTRTCLRDLSDTVYISIITFSEHA